MVSAIWTTSSEGRLDELQELLKNSSNADVNVKDDAGVTPLIAAVKNGHLEVIQVLLAHGADPMSASSQGPPQSYTQHPAILELLNSAQAKIAPPLNENGFYSEAYSYYPPAPEGAVFYPPPPPPQSEAQSGQGNLPPPEIARLIPCRYFPACRYGSSCLFAHPQGPYLSGPLPPPAQYPSPYDPMNSNYPPNYYPISAPSFQPPPPNGLNPILSPTNGVVTPQTSEMAPPFSPNGPPPPAPYTAVSPVGSPNPFPQPGAAPMSAPSIPPIYHQSPPPSQQQAPMPPNVYNNTSPPAPPFVVHPNGVPQFPPPNVSAQIGYPDGVIKSPPLNPQSDSYAASAPLGPQGPPRESVGHARRGSVRRGSFNSRKPPCLFYPAGKCKNGDDCRFPHVLSSDFPSQHHSYGGRGGGPRPPRGHVNGNGNGLDAKMASLTIRESRSQNGHDAKADNNRSRFSQGYKNGSNVPNNKRLAPLKQQRVPNADEFPVLGAMAAPGKTNGVSGYLVNGNGQAGPTAAQILQAPAPRKDVPIVSGTATRTPSDSGSVKGSETDAPAPLSSPHSTAQKLPLSFATIAANGTAEVAAEVSVSA